MSHAANGPDSSVPPTIVLTESNLPEWKRVASGLAWIYYGLAVGILLLIAFSVAFAFLRDSFDAQKRNMVWLNIAIAMTVADAVGKILCLATPEETRATVLIRGSVVLMVINLSLSGLNLMFGGLPPILRWVGMPVGLVSVLLFVLFLRKLALFFQSKKLAARARNLIVVGLVFIALLLYEYFLIAAALPEIHKPHFVPSPQVIIIGLVLGIGSWYLLIKYLSLLRDLRRAIRSSYSPPPAG